MLSFNLKINNTIFLYSSFGHHYYSNCDIFLYFFDFIYLLALVGVDEVTRLNLAKVTRLKLAKNATYTSPTTRNSLLEAIHSVVQVGMSIHCVQTQLYDFFILASFKFV